MTRTIHLSISGTPGAPTGPDSPPEGLAITDIKKSMSLDGTGLTVSFLVTLASGVSCGVLANWLYAKYFQAQSSASKKEITTNNRLRLFVREDELALILEQETRVSDTQSH